MSVDIDWSRLDSALGDTIRDLLNVQLSDVLELPDFLQKVEVLSFDLGKIAPEITIQDISSPFPEFYEEDDEEGQEEEDIEQDASETSHIAETNVDFAEVSVDPSSRRSSLRRHSLVVHNATSNESAPDNMDDLETASTASSGPPPYAEHLAHRSLHSMSGWEGINVPYFHSAFASPNGGIVSASGLSTPQPWFMNSSSSFRPTNTFAQHRINQTNAPGRVVSSSSGSNVYVGADNEANAAPGRTPSSPQDTQLELRIQYTGNIMIVLCAHLALNYPSSAFVTLPIEMAISNFEIDAVTVMASIGKKVHVALLNGRESPIKAMKISSVIGEQGKMSLTDVDRLEKFMVKEIQDVIEREFVLPSYYTFLL